MERSGGRLGVSELRSTTFSMTETHLAYWHILPSSRTCHTLELQKP